MMKIKRTLMTSEILKKKDNEICSFDTSHEYYVHDLKYDYFGERLLTCGSDHCIKVFDKIEPGKWKLKQSWKAHDSTIFRVDWTHPEFGQVIASCSLDGSVALWEETTVKSKTETKKNWVKIRNLIDNVKDNISDLKFGPKHFGLKLAFCDVGGMVRIFNAPKIMDLNIWDEESKFKSCEKGCTCLDWNKSHTDGLVLVVGGLDGSVKIWAWSMNVQKWIGLKDLAATNKINKRYQIIDVSWAPMMGRNHFLIAAVSKNRRVRIWKLKREIPFSNGKFKKYEKKSLNFKSVELKIDESVLGDVDLCSVSWNLTGSILAVGGVGVVYLFKYLRNSRIWKCTKIINKYID